MSNFRGSHWKSSQYSPNMVGNFSPNWTAAIFRPRSCIASLSLCGLLNVAIIPRIASNWLFVISIVSFLFVVVCFTSQIIAGFAPRSTPSALLFYYVPADPPHGGGFGDTTARDRQIKKREGDFSPSCGLVACHRMR